MLTVRGIYKNGKIKLEESLSFNKVIRVIVTFLDEEKEKNTKSKKLSWHDFSFNKAQKLLKDYKGSFSDAVIEERRD